MVSGDTLYEIDAGALVHHDSRNRESPTGLFVQQTVARLACNVRGPSKPPAG
ncbi:hypothetical protein [Streptomyces celluloflavus]|uniref:hypothetical protein n=1 Tax=Streptomyces celluloflavus TaxID=58344 RepID=UPI0034609EE0|nr:hypothetical protein OG717_32835 [Streptomyces celluloflavus]